MALNDCFDICMRVEDNEVCIILVVWLYFKINSGIQRGSKNGLGNFKTNPIL